MLAMRIAALCLSAIVVTPARAQARPGFEGAPEGFPIVENTCAEKFTAEANLMHCFKSEIEGYELAKQLWRGTAPRWQVACQKHKGKTPYFYYNLSGCLLDAQGVPG